MRIKNPLEGALTCQDDRAVIETLMHVATSVPISDAYGVKDALALNVTLMRVEDTCRKRLAMITSTGSRRDLDRASMTQRMSRDFSNGSFRDVLSDGLRRASAASRRLSMDASQRLANSVPSLVRRHRSGSATSLDSRGSRGSGGSNASRSLVRTSSAPASLDRQVLPESGAAAVGSPWRKGLGFPTLWSSSDRFGFGQRTSKQQEPDFSDIR